ncbi:MAG: SAM-dependent methyltransferase, partial [Rhodobacteraceae bacterium PARR1]
MRHTQTFWNDFFFDIFGVKRERVAVYERSVDKLRGARGRIDLFWPGELIIEQKSLGRDLLGARLQALDYTHGLTDAEMPKRVLVCDFRTFELTDLTTNETVAFTLEDLPKHIDRFGFILGRQVARFKDQDPVNIKAAELVGLLHDLLLASGYKGHRLEVFLTRIVFCLFADDTGIFEPKDILFEYLDEKTATDGSDVGATLAQLFDVLNTPEDQRQTTLDPDLARFPYVNGHLFAEYFPPPVFDADMRAALLNACRFDWTPISPAIFGSLFQSVMDAGERRRAGAHYTTEKNILKLIGPLFLDDLRAEFAAIKTRRTGRDAALKAFHDKLAGLTFFDPACGCGNFLIIAYRELRLLELELLQELNPMGQQTFHADSLSRVDVDQFYGIEVSEFPARIAETALWMMDHLMNLRLSAAFGGYFPRIPLKKAPTIKHADALEVDWATVLPPARCSHVLGNPPFVGAKFQSAEQREQVRRIANLGKSGGTLDFVAAWFIKAGEYVQGDTRIAFVSTNSVTQGEQVAQLWPLLLERCGLEISFAHRTFEWGSDARGKAHVHVVIVGLDRRTQAPAQRRLFSYPSVKSDPVETIHKAISPYLFDASGLNNPHTVVREESRPINGMKSLITGSKPIDDGNYILSEEEYSDVLQMDPDSAAFFRPFIGAREFIQGGMRFIVHPASIPLPLLRKSRFISERIKKVREFRAASESKPTQQLSNAPNEFHVTVIPTKSFLVIPQVSSEKRAFAPIAWLEPPTIPSDKLRVLLDASLTDFGVLTSTMHMAWMRATTGRMKSDYMYSVGVVYNTFPLPPLPNLSKLDPLAQTVLDARAAHPG